ncbi:TPA: hypothetical protein U5D59_000447, partial [Yersinia enterocolitica]|nr:hypothetical protein [Yersinia enterocolitica]
VESVFPTNTGSTINHPGNNRTLTSAKFDDIAAALIPVGDKSVTLNHEETIFRRRYYHNGANAGFILYADESDLDDEKKERVTRKIEEIGGKVEFKNTFIDTSAPTSAFRLGILSEECTAGDARLIGDNTMFVCNVYENDNDKGQLFFGPTNGLSSDEIRLALSGLSYQEREAVRAEVKSNINEKLKEKYGQSLDRTIVINIKDGEIS